MFFIPLYLLNINKEACRLNELTFGFKNNQVR